MKGKTSKDEWATSQKEETAQTKPLSFGTRCSRAAVAGLQVQGKCKVGLLIPIQEKICTNFDPQNQSFLGGHPRTFAFYTGSAGYDWPPPCCALAKRIAFALHPERFSRFLKYRKPPHIDTWVPQGWGFFSVFWMSGCVPALACWAFLSLCPLVESLQVMFLLSPPCQPTLRRQESSQLHRCHMHTQLRSHPGATNHSLPPGTLPGGCQKQVKLALVPLELGHGRVMTQVQTFRSILGLETLIYSFYAGKHFLCPNQSTRL